MTWKYNDEDFTEVPKDMEGFVYLIINLTNNRKYIGKKHFWTRQKDRKTGRRKKKESNWKIYFGSCDKLNEDIKLLGEDNSTKILSAQFVNVFFKFWTRPIIFFPIRF
jgi:hypothetical protein